VAALGERVEEGVGGGVVGLTGIFEGGRDRGEENELGERHLPGQLVQVPGGVGLGGEDGAEVLGTQIGNQAVVGGASAVHNRPQRPLGGDRLQELLELLAIGDVAGDGLGFATQLC
jgi:hypothetical protein